VDYETSRAGKDRHSAPPLTILTVIELSEYLRVHPTTIYRLLRSKQIPGFHVGSDWRFDAQMIDRWRRSEEKRAAVSARRHKGS
jgi:excisionase family DNA binding protein